MKMALSEVFDNYYILIKPPGKLDEDKGLPQSEKILTMTADMFLAAFKCFSAVTKPPKSSSVETQTVTVKTELCSTETQTPEAAVQKEASTQTCNSPPEVCTKCRGGTQDKTDQKTPTQSNGNELLSPTEKSMEEHFKRLPSPLRHMVLTREKETEGDLQKLPPMKYLLRYLSLLQNLVQQEPRTTSLMLIKRFVWLLKCVATDFAEDSSRPQHVIALYHKVLVLARQQGNWSFNPALDKAKTALKEQRTKEAAEKAGQESARNQRQEEARKLKVELNRICEPPNSGAHGSGVNEQRYNDYPRIYRVSDSSPNDHPRSTQRRGSTWQPSKEQSPDDVEPHRRERPPHKRRSPGRFNRSPVGPKRAKYDDPVSGPRDPRRLTRTTSDDSGGERAEPSRYDQAQQHPRSFDAHRGPMRECSYFNIYPRCNRGSKCTFRHVCSFCKSPTHGRNACGILINALKVYEKSGSGEACEKR